MSFIAEMRASVVQPPIQNATLAINCTTTVQVIDLCSIPGNPVKAGGDPDSKNPVGHFIRITADGGNIYYVTGSNFNSLNAIPNTVSYSTVNATTGAVTLTGNEEDVIYSGGEKHFIVMANGTPQTQNPPGGKSVCRYLAVQTSTGSAVARIYQVSA